MPYIKTHSNYVLQSRHQSVSDGTIWERDITTIGGVNQFSPGQIPIYRSSNFIITVRNDGKVSNQYNKGKWVENESGDVWTLETLSATTSEFEDQNDVKIVLKKDYYDFRDFAYYGSLSELFRSSINDVFNRFPGELYLTPNAKTYYTSSYTEDFETVTDEIPLGDTDDTYVSNPYGIDIHSITKPVEAKPIKYFAENGYDNYEIIVGNSDTGTPITTWSTRVFSSVVKKKDVLDAQFGDDLFYQDYMSGKMERIATSAGQSNREIRWMENTNNVISGYSVDCNGAKKDYNVGWNDLVECFKSGEIHEKYLIYENTRFHVIKDGVDMGSHTEGHPTQQEAAAVITAFQEQETAAYEAAHEAWEEGGEQGEEPKESDYLHDYGIREYNPCGDLSCFILVTPCKGYKMGSVTANTVVIDAWIGDYGEIVYLSKQRDIHIRPIEKFITEFYNECNNFERLILNRTTTPLYKSSFSVIKENERGYYREMEDFIFPTSYGGYNLDAESTSFTNFSTRLSEIGNYYDEFFTDNLYRSMTHEAIKNFDWTYTREFYEGEEEQYREGGEKIQKALRLFAREFDEILSYINEIKNTNRITYDERSNLPNYFLTDAVETKGWDVKLIYPYELEEYLVDASGNTITDASGNVEYVSDYVEQDQLDNKIGDNYIVRQFSQNPTNEVTPYDNLPEELKFGYFVSCSTPKEGEETISLCEYPECKNWNDPEVTFGPEPTQVGDLSSCGAGGGIGVAVGRECADTGVTFTIIKASGASDFMRYDSSDGSIQNRIKSYSDGKSYTYFDINNEFMRRLAINSSYIWRHKGTVEGIEMILGMFGLKSQRWVDGLGDGCKESAITADYDVSEYSSFTTRIEDEWDAVHQMYRIDWINSTKTIVYNYRSTSNDAENNSKYYGYLPYQGIPVSYLDETVQVNAAGTITNKPYIKISSLGNQESTASSAEAFTRIDRQNDPVLRRYLYPHFSKEEQLDGNPYFQMKGGWLAKTVENEANKKAYNFQYDVDDNICYTCEVLEGNDTNGIVDNHPIYKETIRNIRRVDTIGDLISLPLNTLKDGSIYYVTKVENDIAIINNSVYKIFYEYSGNENKPLMYVLLKKENGNIKIGDDRFFDDTIVVYEKYPKTTADTNVYGDYTLKETSHYLLDKQNGYEVKAYISYSANTNGTKTFDFVCKSNSDGVYTIDSFVVLDSLATPNDTNYFIIYDSYYGNRLASDTDKNGWIRLKEKDLEYIRINTIANYYKGNNPHNGYMDYDSGHEYFLYYKKLFKNAIENYLFDERCYENFYGTLYSEIYNYGFTNLVHDNEEILQYTPYLIQDSKIHYFGNYYKKGDETPIKCTDVMYYGDNDETTWRLQEMYNHNDSAITVTKYILNSDDNLIGGSPYSGQTGETVDSVCNQIMNNKRLTIRFFLHNNWESKEGQCEIKYLDDVVMNYLAQMIPSTTIVDVRYVKRNLEENGQG